MQKQRCTYEMELDTPLPMLEIDFGDPDRVGVYTKATHN